MSWSRWCAGPPSRHRRATAETAYLLLGQGLVALELSTGQQSRLIGPGTGGIDLADTIRGDIQAGLIAVPDRAGPRCAIHVLRLRDGQERARSILDGACAATVRLSPDGRLLSAVYARSGSEPQRPAPGGHPRRGDRAGPGRRADQRR